MAKKQRRVFKESVRKEIKRIRSGKIGGRTRGGANKMEEGAAAAGGKLPSRLWKAAKKGKTSRPARKKRY